MTQQLDSMSLSGVDPFRMPDQPQPPVGEAPVENAWFDAPASSRRPPSVRPSPSNPPTPPIGDRDADAWFR